MPAAAAPARPAPRRQPTPEDIASVRLLDFCRYMWPGYQVGRHHRLIAEHLEAVARGTLKRLMIWTPPRHGKTILTSQYFPAWYFGRRPDHEIITVAYGQSLATDYGRRVRDMVRDPSYQKIFRGVTLSADSKAAARFNIFRPGRPAGQPPGAYYAVGIDGPTTGRGANAAFIDDPYKGLAEAQSAAVRRHVREWYQSTLYTRLMPDPQKPEIAAGAIVLTQTRWVDDDLSGWLLKEHAHENWTVLDLPAIAEEDRDWTFADGEVWHRKAGDPLWPERFPLSRLLTIKQTQGTQGWSALYQQRPTPSEGGMVRLEWFKRFIHPPLPYQILRVIVSLDTAVKDAEVNDYSAAGVWVETELGYHRVGGFRERFQYPDLKRSVLGLVEKVRADFGVLTALLIEDKGSGSVLIQELRRETTLPVLPQMPRQSKLVRFQGVTPLIEAGRVWLPEPSSGCPWLIDYEQEMLHFPNAAHDDQVDETSQALAWFQGPAVQRIGPLRQWRKR